MLAAIAGLASSCVSGLGHAAPADLDSLSTWSGSTTVHVGQGSLKGSVDRMGTLAWKGIRYASPPVGAGRWMPPKPPEPWPGLRYALDYRQMPAQKIPLIGGVLGSEDCLFLNVWRPATREKSLPVHVWIHGGDNLVGSADINPDFHGHAIAAKANCVSVSLNYRLGPLGWFSHPALKTGDREADSGNYGLLDIIAGLRWVQANIKAFGGDPGNITLSGESSGAVNILYLMVSPLAKGLFHKAIAQSPYSTGSSEANAERYGASLANKLLSKKPGFKASQVSAADLRALDAGSLVSTQTSNKIRIAVFPFPILDGYVVPKIGLAAFSDPAAAPIPLIIGSTKEETKVFQWFDGQNPGDPGYQARARRDSAQWKSENVDALADLIAGTNPGRQVYVYRFDWGAPDAQGRSVLGGRAGITIGASHGLDMSFFMLTDTVYGGIFPFRLFTKANEKGRNELKDRMAAYISSFMRTGNPEKDGPEGQWKPWKPEEPGREFLVLDADLDTARIRTEH